ncbi:MAG: dnaX [Candidatus Saccharibacteria bacterium]|nr:dnaX [Candidatus Saccharibacteria bacterium]
MSKALYRKYRSKSLDEVIGQSHVTDILRRSLAQGRIAHAYLLTGPRGVGKTSIARILAYEINKIPYDEEATNLDIIEIDAASNNGVEDVRDLREKVQIAPVAASKKIYIIDEVHMLSKQAFNALLKTLEEPPAHAVFILATTDVDKLPATIISRTQRFSFRSISVKDAAAHLKSIAEKERIAIDDAALELIATRGDGSFRDSISLLDQLQGLTDNNTTITRELIEQSLGLAPSTLIKSLIDAYESKDLKAIVNLLDDSEKNGIQSTVIASQLVSAVRAHIAEKPQLIQLLDQLLDVTKSSQPNIKLLTILATHAVPKPKTAALAIPAAEVSAPLAELQKQATKAKPSIAPIARQITKPAPVAPRPATPSIVDTPTPPTTSGADFDFDWEKLLAYTRANYVAIYSVLGKCGHAHEGDRVTLYTGTTFWKRKLDDPKHRFNLMDALAKVGAGDVILETIGTPPPPKDETAAAVAAIMGGGEEVSVGE